MQIKLATVSVGGVYQQAPKKLIEEAIHDWTERNGFGLPAVDVRIWRTSADEVDVSLEFDNVNGMDVNDLLAFSDHLEDVVEAALFDWNGDEDREC